MVNIPVNVSTFPTDEIGAVTDINQNINQEYYEWLLKQHNYFPDCAFHKEKFSDTIKMEHSYTRDWKPTSNNGMMPTRTILVERPPLCPSCHQSPPNHDEKVDTPEAYNIPIPPYNEEAGRQALNATADLIKSCQNRNSDTDDWTQNIQKFSWTDQQLNLFERIERILDMDQLGRLAVSGLANECLRRNAIIEKSVSRMRAALASVQWEPQLTSWLHDLLMANLPSNYMVSYIDILQTLKRKIPALIDKLLYHRPIEMHKDYMSAILKRPWQSAMVVKTRVLPSNPVIVLVSSIVSGNGSGDPTTTASREKRWIELLNTLTSVELITINAQAIDSQQSIEQVTEQLIGITRAKIQAIRNKTPNRHIILAGFNGGAALTLQVALVEPVNSIICLGFAFNTLYGVRGAPDDRIIVLTTPVLFVIGQNAQRSSQEEIESLRERMSAQTLLVVVGSSDDALRVKRLNRSMEGVSQAMIDSMIMDEIQEFATNCILNPPGPRNPKHLNGHRKAPKQRAAPIENGLAVKRTRLNGKSKFKVINGKTKMKSNQKIKRLGNIRNGSDGGDDDFYQTQQQLSANNDSDDSLVQIDFENVIPHGDIHPNDAIMQNTGNANNAIVECNGSPSLRQKVKYIPANKFVHLKPPPINTQKIYVKQQQNGSQSYTLGVKNIGTADIPVMHNELITVEHNALNDDLLAAEATETEPIYKSDEETSELTSNTTDDCNTNMENINIFDIPILFADNDGNILENQNDHVNEEVVITQQPHQMTPSKKIEIISEEIITDAGIGNGTMIIEQNGNESDGVESTHGDSLSTPPPKPVLTRSGKFVMLNKSTLSQIETVKRISSGKIKKILFPLRGNDLAAAVTTTSTRTTTTAAAAAPTTNGSKRLHSIILNNSSALPSESPVYANKTYPLSVDPSVNGTRFESFTRLEPTQNHTKLTTNNITVSVNERPKSPKSGILIKRNHMKNFTIRKVNVIRTPTANDTKAIGARTNNNHKRMISRSLHISINNNNSKDTDKDSLKSLIADLEN